MSTVIRPEMLLTLTAVDSTPLDGSTSGRTYQATDRTTGQYVVLSEEADAIVITMDGTGSDGNSAVFTIWGYSRNGPAERIYHTVTGTLGTATAATGRTFADQFSGTDTHITTVAVKDSGADGNTIAKLALDPIGYRFLMFEPITFTGLTAITFHVREYGLK